MKRWRSVSMRSGSRLLIVTLSRATSRERPLQTAVSALRAAVERPIAGCGAFTIADVTFTMRPKRRARMPPITRSDHQHRRQQVGLEGGEPARVVPVLEAARRRAAVVVDQDVRLGAGSHQRRTTLLGAEIGDDRRDADLLSRRISSAVASRRAASRPFTTISTPSAARARAQARPSPRLDAQTMRAPPRDSEIHG